MLSFPWALAKQKHESPRRRLAEAQLRAHRVLTRLATSMQRCVTKANGEMAYQLLYQQEAYMSYTGYQLFTRYITWAVQRCRDADMEGALTQHPDMEVMSLDVSEPLVQEQVALDAVGVLQEDTTDAAPTRGNVRPRFITANQKDDYLHRGPAGLLANMSLLMYSRFVFRRKREHRQVDRFQYFPFDEHYVMHRAGYVQAGELWFLYIS